MMNKKLIALLVAVTTISTSVLAYDDDCWIDKDGKERCKKGRHFYRTCDSDDEDCGLVRGTPRRVGETVESAGETVVNAANAATFGLIRPIK
jgi:hypothetical protein